jgi:outer membrane lipopolysaccharide assembly protein LptE/RlpB
MPAIMRAQQRQLRKNYIGVVSDSLDEQNAIELRTKSEHRVKDYLSRLVAVVLKRRAGAR